MDSARFVQRDLWASQRKFTAARIALGRAGGSLPTAPLLEFRAHHAGAIDAVRAGFDRDALAEEVRLLGLEPVLVETRAADLETFLLRPDFGRRLDDASRDRLVGTTSRAGSVDVAINVVDGLSALAVHRHAVAVIAALLPKLAQRGLSVGPVPIVRHGRVALQDEIGAILGARAAVSLIGERPGLGAPDSLGAYLVFGPKPGNTDANRNCVSNIRPAGLAPESAAATLDYLINESLRLQLSGVNLKDEREIAIGPRRLDPQLE